MTATKATGITIGDPIGPLEKNPTPTQLVQFTGAAEIWVPQHYDLDEAKRLGNRGVLVQGMLEWAWLGQLVEEWAARRGTHELVRLSQRNRAMAFAGDRLLGQGVVTEVADQGESVLVTCDVWIDRNDGTRIVEGTAQVRIR